MDIIKLPKFNTIFIHEDADKELKKITKGWGDKAKFQKWLFDRLAQLDDCNFVYSDYPRYFEPIEEFYAITYRHSKKNIRILYYVDNGIKKILFCSFDEKNTKADYSNAKKVARQRLKQYKEGKPYGE